jgi:hypothetical protein
MTTYRHLVGGFAYGVSHAPGDLVAQRVPKRKLAEWLAAGIIAPVDDDEGEDR